MPTAAAPDYAAFLASHLASQADLVQRHPWQGESLWLKRAGQPHPAWRYRVLAAVAGLLRVPALQPVPNPGGTQAIATEVRRLQTLAARGLRVPQVLAVVPQGFLMRDLGQAGRPVQSLGHALEQAGTGVATLALWQQGLAALRQVHDRGQCLSQAFARNMVLCPDGEVGFIDFEDDPAAHLPLHQCQLRDVLCYIHSTAWIVARAGMLPAAQAYWQSWQAGMHPEARDALALARQRLRGLRWLPLSRRLGRDTQRLRQAWTLLTGVNS
ncbi:Uncharacterised protein [uncultured Comamonas sp.]|nr:Uncharacterised protein [uncultured Comamonas sp.]